MVIVRTFGDAIVSQELNNRLLFCVYSQNKFHTDEFWHFFGSVVLLMRKPNGVKSSPKL